MIKKLTHLLRNIVGRIKKLLKEYIVELYLTMIVLGITTVITLGPNLKPEDKWLINVTFGLVLFGFIMAIMTILSRSKEVRRKERLEFIERQSQFTTLIKTL